MDVILQAIPRVICYIDDILVTGATDEEHYRNLEEVFRRLQNHGITVSQINCKFLCDYLGYKISREGLHCKNEWVILTLLWLHEFQFLLRLYKSMLLSCLAR